VDFLCPIIAAFGVQNILWARHGDPILPMIPWLPGMPFLAYLTGIAFLATGICIAFHGRAREAVVLLGILFLVFEVLLQIPRAIEQPLDIGLRTVVF